MATTAVPLPKDTWVEVATSGGGKLTNPAHFPIVYAFDSAPPSSVNTGHILARYETVDLTLPGTENLYCYAGHKDGSVQFTAS